MFLHAQSGKCYCFVSFNGDDLSLLATNQVGCGDATLVQVPHAHHPVVVEHLTHVSDTMIHEDHHHHITFLKAIGHLGEALHGSAGGVAHPDRFFSYDAAGHDGGVFIGHLFKVIDHREVDILRQKIFSDPFGHIGIDLILIELARLLEFLKNRTVSINAQHLDRRILFFQIFTRTGNGTTSSHTCYKVGDPSFGLLPDLRAGCQVVCFAVGKIIILVGFPGIGYFTYQAGRNGIIGAGIFRIYICGAYDDLSAISSQCIEFLRALFVGTGEDAFIALDDSSDGQTHAGVTGSAFNDDATRFQRTTFLGIFYHL